ncbi:hypothetical protein ASG49_00100 [Marmoricola sp. Leaf446]|uniref:TetR/AcrR family transcriptional regulator n=1 Tax=Marmoricola sp. Leaf446 TaxID=1736379 RepID=UPI0006F4175E|nr:TetR/AcrR family transcriptional regulator [Marmoricola sp. Leaf446]KQT93470.1 hypothetical protein ASG49_00100 [Marmoricola sp. Leaf446]
MAPLAPPRGLSALREARRRAILEATRALATEHGADGFTVEQVAERAGVSRRTIFNYVAGLDQLLVEVCEQILDDATTALLAEIFRRWGDDDAAAGTAAPALLDAVAQATRSIDLPSAIASIDRALGSPDSDDERLQVISRTAFDHAGGRLREQLLHRAPDLDPVDLEIGLALLFAGIAVIAEIWLDRHRDPTSEVSPTARADWAQLLDRVLVRVRTG